MWICGFRTCAFRITTSSTCAPESVCHGMLTSSKGPKRQWHVPVICCCTKITRISSKTWQKRPWGASRPYSNLPAGVCALSEWATHRHQRWESLSVRSWLDVSVQVDSRKFMACLVDTRFDIQSLQNPIFICEFLVVQNSQTQSCMRSFDMPKLFDSTLGIWCWPSRLHVFSCLCRSGSFIY